MILLHMLCWRRNIPGLWLTSSLLGFHIVLGKSPAFVLSREGSLLKPQPSWGSSPHKLSKDEILLAQNKPRVISPTPHTTHLVQPQSRNSKTNSWGYSWGDAVGNSPGDMESLPAAMSVTGHARSRGCFALPALLFTDVAGLQKKKK